MKTNPLFHKFLTEVKAGLTNCKIDNDTQALWHLNRALAMAKKQKADRLEYDVTFWIELINLNHDSKAIIGMSKCIRIMENFKLLLDQEEN